MWQKAGAWGDPHTQWFVLFMVNLSRKAAQQTCSKTTDSYAAFQKRRPKKSSSKRPKTKVALSKKFSTYDNEQHYLQNFKPASRVKQIIINQNMLVA